jgi:uncharacterized protein YyaL (SSP411 family)
VIHQRWGQGQAAQANRRKEEQLRQFYDFSDRAASQPASARRSLSGGFYSTEEVTLCDTILRLKSGMDKSQPSTNAVSASNLFRLGTSRAKPEYMHLAKETISAFESEILQYPWLFVSLLTGVVAARLSVKRVLVSSEDDAELRRYRTSPRAEAAALILEGKPDPFELSIEGAVMAEVGNDAGGAQSTAEQLADNQAKVDTATPPHKDTAEPTKAAENQPSVENTKGDAAPNPVQPGSQPPSEGASHGQ